MKPSRIKKKKDLQIETVQEYTAVEEMKLKYKIANTLLKYILIIITIVGVGITIYSFTNPADVKFEKEWLSTTVSIFSTILEAAIK